MNGNYFYIEMEGRKEALKSLFRRQVFRKILFLLRVKNSFSNENAHVFVDSVVVSSLG